MVSHRIPAPQIPMNITIANTTFNNVKYDALGDVLYLNVGDPADAITFDDTPEGTTSAGTQPANSSLSPCYIHACCLTRTARSRSRCRPGLTSAPTHWTRRSSPRSPDRHPLRSVVEQQGFDLLANEDPSLAELPARKSSLSRPLMNS